MKKVRSINLHKGRHLERPESHTILDIDGVLARFTHGFIRKAKAMGYGDLFPKSEKTHKIWDFGVPAKVFKKVWNEVKDDYSFWLGLKPYPNALSSLTFLPIAYITHRPVPNEITQQWLTENGFPVPERCITVADPKEKVILAKKMGAKRIIDDRADTCQTFIDAGLDAYLFTQPYNILIEDVERIASLADIDHEGIRAAA